MSVKIDTDIVTQTGRQIDVDTYKQIKLKDTEIDTDIVTQTRTSWSHRHSHTDTSWS